MTKLHLAWLRLNWDLQCLQEEQETLASVAWNKLSSSHKGFVVRTQSLDLLSHLLVTDQCVAPQDLTVAHVSAFSWDHSDALKLQLSYLQILCYLRM